MQHLTPKEAYEFLHKNPSAIFIDCRSEMEFLFVGHPTSAIMIPWNDGPDWEVNPHFVGHVRKAASLDAGAALEKAGFTQVFNVLHGFEGELNEHHQRNSMTGWRYEGLPWEQC
jgi:rhodanese-related sulfurtransferase